MAAGVSQRRATSLGPPERFLLEQWARTIAEAFGCGFPYLVGSVARDEAWRDVDVRLMMPAEEYAGLIAHDLLSAAVSVWGQLATGLPIDFQFQEITAANELYGGKRRIPLGMLTRGER